MKHLLAFLFMVCVWAVSAQGFSKRHVDVRPAMVFSKVVSQDSSYYTSGVVSTDSQPYLAKVMWATLSAKGDLEHYVVYEDNDPFQYSTYLSELLLQGDTIVKMFGYRSDTVNVYPLLRTIRIDGTVMRNVSYPDNNTDFRRGDYMACGSQTGCYLACSYQYVGGNVDCNIIKVDKSDSVIWSKNYGLTNGNWWESPSSILYLNNGHVLIGSWKFQQNSLPNMKSYTWLFEIDTNGTIARQWFDSDSTMEAKGLKQTKDGGFIYASKEIQWQDIGDAFCHTTIVKIDSVFAKEWTWESQIITSSFIGVEDIEELQDGGYIAAGNGNFVNPQYNLLSAFIIKLKEDGSVVWSNGYTGLDTPGVENFLNDIDILPDGSYVAVGYVNLPLSVQSTQRQQAWILKVDSNGCVIDNCIVGVEDSPQPINHSEAQIKVFPNPATNEVVVDYGFTDWSKGNVTLQITNALGQAVHTQTLPLYSGFQKLNISTYPAGTYLITLLRGTQTIATTALVKE